MLRAIRWNFMPFGKKYPEYTPFCECSGQEPRLCFGFVKYVSVQLLTQCPPRCRGCCGCVGRCGCGFEPIIIGAGSRHRQQPQLCRRPPLPPASTCACAGRPPLGLKISSLQSELSTNITELQPANWLQLLQPCTSRINIEAPLI